MAVPLVPLKARRGKELMYLDHDRGLRGIAYTEGVEK
jgi:hypothetical protein